MPDTKPVPRACRAICTAQKMRFYLYLQQVREENHELNWCDDASIAPAATE